MSSGSLHVINDGINRDTSPIVTYQIVQQSLRYDSVPDYGLEDGSRPQPTVIRVNGQVFIIDKVNHIRRYPKTADDFFWPMFLPAITSGLVPR